MALQQEELSNRHIQQARTVPGSAGFTILEIVIVIILVAILVVSVAPKFLKTEGFSLEGAAGMIAADIRYVQELAMATHDNKNAVFNNGSTSYTVETVTDGVSRTVTLPSGVTISSANITFTFNPLGEPTSGAGSSVTISAGSDSRTISVESFTGKVTIS